MRNPKPNSTRLSRRDLLKGALAGASAAFAGCVNTGNTRSSTPKSSLIHRENQLPGSRDWILEKARVDPRTKYRSPWIEGFASATSVRAGHPIELFVSTNPPSDFTKAQGVGFSSGGPSTY